MYLLLVFKKRPPFKGLIRCRWRVEFEGTFDSARCTAGCLTCGGFLSKPLYGNRAPS
jgi:hypothetical protein